VERGGIAPGSLAELETQLIIAARLGFFDESRLATFLAQAADISRMLSGLKTSLKRRS
jgi:four helix bundle protein